MVMTRGSTVFMDTNVLLSATAAGREDHAIARDLFGAAHDAGVHFALCGQILREYLVVATRPVDVNGLGMATGDELSNVEWFRRRMIVLEETESVLDQLLRLAQEITRYTAITSTRSR